MPQPGFAALAYEGKKKQTRKGKFLSETDQISPWKQLVRLISPYYPKAGNGRPPVSVEKMPRIYPMRRFTLFSFANLYLVRKQLLYPRVLVCHKTGNGQKIAHENSELVDYEKI